MENDGTTGRGAGTAITRIETDDGTEVGRIRLFGEIDHAEAGRLDEAVRELLDKGVDRLVVDFAELSFFDSACLSALVRARAQAEDHEAAIVLENVNRYAHRILELTGLTGAFTIKTEN
ncbi:STAS domain-containing protein [Amycolatopsis rhizosphaerae]|uniref:Anti-sigma factor antagonist n=1 Tax=Amycolatopsis rhizosphaerae TaxID=2053003 RepID=A0A558CCN7_9PSEU|nr:STAS domain-containing protein [Amycolatopsis rhizosphaerae]TVT46412.1 STAS domain-containing protein [Amycolatopsis rhizosphaerae]